MVDKDEDSPKQCKPDESLMMPGLVRKSENGLAYVKLVNENGSSAEIYLHDGTVTSYKDKDGTEYMAMRPDNASQMMDDAFQPVRGGVSLCWPQVRTLSKLV